MSAKTLEALPIAAQLVPEKARYNFLPTYYRSMFMAAETLTYVFAGRFFKGYAGGYWKYFTLSNGGFFVALDTDDPIRVVIKENYTDVAMSAEAAGIVVTMFVLNYIAGARIRASERQKAIEHYNNLYDYVCEHDECEVILGAIS